MKYSYGTSPVPHFIWGGTVGNVPQGNALAVYSTPGTKGWGHAREQRTIYTL